MLFIVQNWNAFHYSDLSLGNVIPSKYANPSSTIITVRAYLKDNQYTVYAAGYHYKTIASIHTSKLKTLSFKIVARQQLAHRITSAVGFIRMKLMRTHQKENRARIGRECGHPTLKSSVLL